MTERIPPLPEIYGEAHRFPLGAADSSPVADVEVYPESQMVRYITEGLQVTLSSAKPGNLHMVFSTLSTHPPAVEAEVVDQQPEAPQSTQEETPVLSTAAEPTIETK